MPDSRPQQPGLEELREQHAEFCERREQINMTRGLPSPEQIALSRDFLSLPGTHQFSSQDGQDWLNYGGLQGVREVRDLFGPVMLGLPGEQVAVGENSSLALMHETIGHAWIKGFPGTEPWGKAEKVRFICPEPGYDRHFSICEYYGIEMIPVDLNEHGPDMDAIERLVATDSSIRGMWCVPKHANPNGAIYSKDVVDRLAGMMAAAADFKLFWDNAYAIHDFDEFANPAPDLYAACVRAGNPDRAVMFASTSKMVIPSSGISMIGASPATIRWWLDCRQHKTIGPDKVNQVRHLMFFQTKENLIAHMKGHGQLLGAKFDRVQQVFSRRLEGLPDVSWSRPRGGYFISLLVPAGLAKRVVAIAAQAGVKITPAGATHCHGHDAQERHLRIAPSYLNLAQIDQAAEVIAHSVLLACAEHENDHQRQPAPYPEHQNA
ncbi:aminotransferase class I/II-fold pyridoxal phosphate-dependent enzyme [Pseudomonas gingeri]|uniref:Aminotransferase class I/II-fold pyridoxal phosphate-dependent enzyme n=1 Tax=Pseudomonas gingeri TaxID=117681 RepID=A0A7Y7YB15_9PSED|nr:aminotransferase class I/II-fold pyridoxal phosphate-dependent enzyme [Pseudomonas gingeri]NWA03128.1 aminotransferase class I/II-fold pyridoxal phosphate-dependent enzyme [Pseudomonas gingeri]NWA18350.1 aminotransferase class I/II-fold pyridoxal phosphate-dependent enzyme [Pseudomonas gingeri]NWA53169.1 aminotransferase class I/II-fold pyridoxal phosphate-dependent enzyme [Pseudomonas gingeri]NWA99015.1 aminotransferase class I/II-fold pyridoxal phosphate-dependent enzyme [Pseudomonas ginge